MSAVSDFMLSQTTCDDIWNEIIDESVLSIKKFIKEKPYFAIDMYDEHRDVNNGMTSYIRIYAYTDRNIKFIDFMKDNNIGYKLNDDAGIWHCLIYSDFIPETHLYSNIKSHIVKTHAIKHISKILKGYDIVVNHIIWSEDRFLHGIKEKL